MNFSLRDQAIYAFGPFQLDPVRHLLLRDGTPVSLSPRLYDTLLYLVTHAGRVVERDELLHAVWRGRVVDDGNLKQTIFSLRRALQSGALQSGALQSEAPGDRFIITAPSRCYLFAAPVRVESVAEPARMAVATTRAAPAMAGPHHRLAAAAAILMLGVAVSIALLWRPRAPPLAQAPFAPPAHSLAVLAFANLSGEPSQAYFSDGVSEELIAALSRIGALHVAARSSAFSFRGTPATIGEIGRRLNVGAVLEGSVRRADAHVRIATELVDTVSGFTVWSRSYDRDAGDMLQIQADIAQSVAASLQVALLGADAGKLTTGGTANANAFDAYLRGVKLAESASGPAGTMAALPAFDQAIALDPAFALARARRSQALLQIANAEAGGDLAAVRRMLDEAIAEAGRAIAIAPALGVAHLARGAALMSVQDLAGADGEMSQAYALAPGDALVVTDYALSQLQFGRVAAGLRAAEQAAALDPLTPNAYLDLARAYLSAQCYDRARAALRRARILGGDLGADAVERAIALDTGDYAFVLPACERGRTWVDMLCLARAYHGLGRTADAAAQLARLRALLGDGGAYQYAEIYAQWGDRRAAVTWLQTAYRLHDTGLVLMKSDALLAPIRGTAEYADVERRLNFPH